MKTIRTPKKAEAFLAALSDGRSVTSACQVALISKPAAYAWRKEDKDFAAAWDDAVETGTDLLEDEARRRAQDGVEKPVYQGGECVGHVREYSDTLMIFLLKARRPEKYRERHDVNHGGTVGVEISDARETLQRKLAGLAAASGEGIVPREPD